MGLSFKKLRPFIFVSFCFLKTGLLEATTYYYTCAQALELLKRQNDTHTEAVLPGLQLREPVRLALASKWKLSLNQLDGAGLMIASSGSFAEIDLHRLAVDLAFNSQSPYVSAANSALWLEDFNASRNGHESTLKTAQKIAEWNQADSLGLFLYGDGGVGKSMLSVGIAKRAMHLKPDLRTALVTREWLDAVRSPTEVLQKIQLTDFIILDDIHNLTESLYWNPILVPLVIWAQEKGGIRIIATSNHPPRELLDGYFRSPFGVKEQRPRFEGRWKAMMIEREMRGQTGRLSAIELLGD